MRTQIIAILIVSFVLTGCSPTTKRFKNLSHSGKAPTALAFIPLQQAALTIDNKKELLDDFEVSAGNAVEIVQDTAYDRIAETLRSGSAIPLVTRTPAGSDLMLDSSNSFSVAIREAVDSDSCLHSFTIPKREMMGKHFEEATAAIIISRMAIRNNVITVYNSPVMTFSNGQPSVMVTGSNTTSRTLEAQVEYVIWDYASNEMISFGKSIVHAPVLVSPTRDNWYTLFEKIGEQILTHMPSRA
jgi:hypothetical protein